MSKDTRAIIEKRKEIREREPQRIPRLKGLTLSLMQAHSHSNQELMKEIKHNLIESWITSGMTIDNKLMNVQQLSQYLNIPTTAILIRMKGAMERFGNWLKDDKLQERTRAIFSQAFFGALEIQALTKEQVYMLRAEQGGQYVPFLTSEMNKALTNLINSNRPITDLLGILKPNTTIIPHSPADGVSNTHAVTPDEAIRIVRDHTKSVLEDPDTLDAVWSEMGQQEALPDVLARNQSDLASIGIGKSQKRLNGPKKPKRPTDEVAPIPSRHRKRDPQPNIITDADMEDFRA